MAEKAMVVQMFGVDLTAGQYVLTGTAAVTDGAGGHINMTFSVTASSFNPLLPPWRTRVRDRIVAQAATDHSLEVDDVLFPDFGVVGL